jgi:hypothetical protein
MVSSPERGIGAPVEEASGELVGEEEEEEEEGPGPS